jgi:hypothetical protein
MEVSKMLKRNADLFIKLLLIMLLVGLLILIGRASKTVEQPIETKAVETKVVEAEPVVLKDEPRPCPEIEEPEPEDEYLTKIQKWEEEHYYATRVWKCLRQRNFSQEVACGIIGNMMIETSGGTLDLKPNIYSPSRNYYGLCQWSQKYYPGTKDLPFEHQLDYLLGTMPWEFNTFGKNYKKGFDYEAFLKITDPAEAALAFAKAYERCSPASYKLRQEAAIKAYEYFDLERP